MVFIFTSLLSVAAIAAAYFYRVIIAYGDAESHLNIAKRVIDSLTPGAAQLGGIWLPLPHLLMLPFIWSDWLWRTGLAGAIVSGAAFVVSGVYIFRLVELVTRQKAAAWAALLVFALNPNILYLQSTPMTELVLISFFSASTYYFVRFIYDREDIRALVLAALFACLASLSRYEGWFLAAGEAGVLILIHFNALRRRLVRRQLEARLILYSTLGFVGIGLWFLWDWLILGDPLYFTDSVFSAKSQQLGWLARGQLPSYHNLASSFIYYAATALFNTGVMVSLVAVLGLIAALVYWFFKKERLSWGLLILLVPFIFYVLTLYLGQSIIFLPGLTPASFPWQLFNVRYGVMMVPAAAFFAGYLFAKVRWRALRVIVASLLLTQLWQFYGPGAGLPIALADGLNGLSSSRSPDAQNWLKANYDNGKILLDDYSRTVSIISSGLPIDQVIYIGNKPYWEESLKTPEKYARWVIMQENDAVWKALYADQAAQGRLYAHYEKAYTSPQILIFKRREQI